MSSKFSQRVVIGLLAAGIFARLIPHPWNATPVLAITLLAATYLKQRWAFLIPVIILAISDLCIGWHVTVPFTWSAMALCGLLGWWIRSKPTATRIFASALIGSVVFYLISNFGVWVVRDFYAKNIGGLWQCYVVAIPFFRTALIGNVIYTAVFFGLYALTDQAYNRGSQRVSLSSRPR